MARTVLAGLFAIGLSALAVPAPAQAAEGYASVDVNVTISDVTQIGGRQIRVHAVARTEFGDPVNCAFTVVFGGDSANHVHVTGNTGNGSEFNRIFNTTRVPRDLTGFAVARCTYDDTTVSPAAVSPSATQTVSSDPGQVNLLALDDDSDDSDSDDSDSDDSDSDDSDDNGGLPNTGGERLLWLLIGLALVAGGTTVILSSRDRDAEA